MIHRALDTPLKQPGRDAASKHSAEPSGSIFNIERLALHDGPGIRSVVFLKGCPLRCLWCSSPESQHKNPELLYDWQRCTHCLACLKACQEEALGVGPDGRVVLNRSQCRACGRCVTVCAQGARSLTGRIVPVSTVMQEIDKDAVFYHRSGGGVTLSGGEPLLQPDFSLAILKASRYRGIHTAMETCGYAPWEKLSACCAQLDLVYMDLKHADAAVHQRLTGVRNDLILKNIRQVDAYCPQTALVIRVPVIPGCNDSREAIQEMAGFVNSLQRPARVELLPYHRYGLGTYERLGQEYRLVGVESPSLEQLEQLSGIFQGKGIAVQVGG